MKVFVTGATGFLGQRLVKRLLADGHSVRVLLRKPGASFEPAGCEITAGTFSNIDEWKRDLAAADAVVHCAAPVEFWGVWADFERDIVRATSNLLSACREMGVKRFIYISSESVLQDKKPLLDIHESEPYPETPNSFYGRAKKEAEQAILSAPAGVTRIILRPTFIWGRGVKALETMAAKVRSGDFMWIDQGASVMEMVHVDNVVEAIVCSLSRGADCGIYYVTDDSPATVREFLSDLLTAGGAVPPAKNMPGSVARAAAAVVEGIWKLFGIRKAPPLSRFELAFVSQPRRYNIAAARSALGYKPVRSRAEGLAEIRANAQK